MCLLSGVCAGCVVLENQLVSSVWGLVEVLVEVASVLSVSL